MPVTRNPDAGDKSDKKFGAGDKMTRNSNADDKSDKRIDADDKTIAQSLRHIMSTLVRLRPC